MVFKSSLSLKFKRLILFCFLLLGFGQTSYALEPYSQRFHEFRAKIETLYETGLESDTITVDEEIVNQLRSKLTLHTRELGMNDSTEWSNMEHARASKRRNFVQEIKEELNLWKKKEAQELLTQHEIGRKLAIEMTYLNIIHQRLLEHLELTVKQIKEEELKGIEFSIEEINHGSSDYAAPASNYLGTLQL